MTIGSGALMPLPVELPLISPDKNINCSMGTIV